MKEGRLDDGITASEHKVVDVGILAAFRVLCKKSKTIGTGQKVFLAPHSSRIIVETRTIRCIRVRAAKLVKAAERPRGETHSGNSIGQLPWSVWHCPAGSRNATCTPPPFHRFAGVSLCRSGSFRPGRLVVSEVTKPARNSTGLPLTQTFLCRLEAIVLSSRLYIGFHSCSLGLVFSSFSLFLFLFDIADLIGYHWFTMTGRNEVYEDMELQNRNCIQ